jgi:hypothetical protein
MIAARRTVLLYTTLNIAILELEHPIRSLNSVSLLTAL